MAAAPAMALGRGAAVVALAVIASLPGCLAAPQCYGQTGTGGLTMKTTLSENCSEKVEFIANILDPVVQTHYCSGVLIDNRTVATPASCVTDIPHTFPIVRLGSLNLNKHTGDKDEELFKVCRKIVHVGYNGHTINGSDIALLELSQDSVQNEPISKEFMSAHKCNTTGGSNLTTIGWFSPKLNGPPSEELEGLPYLMVVDPTECRATLGGIPPKTVCIRAMAATHMVWDKGAPLLCDDRSLAGLASYTIQRPGRYNPYVYTHMADYQDWVDTLGAGAAVVTDNDADEECRKRNSRRTDDEGRVVGDENRNNRGSHEDLGGIPVHQEL